MSNSHQSTSNLSLSGSPPSLIPIPPQSQLRSTVHKLTPKNLGSFARQTFGLISNILLLGFPYKYLRRLQVYANTTEKKEIDEWREGQQDEWNRLATTTSLMATISAASLAFAGIENAWWFARAVFASALGVSLCGFFVLQHFSLLAEGAQNEDVSLAAGGKLKGSPAVVACTLAVPVALSVYSTLLILLGHSAYILTILDKSNDRPTSTVGFKLVAGVPIIFSMLSSIAAVGLAELEYREIDKRNCLRAESEPSQS